CEVVVLRSNAAICATNTSGETPGKPSQTFNTLPFSSISRVYGNLPSALYLSAKASFSFTCSLLSSFFFCRGKSARTNTRCSDAKFSNAADSSISLRSLMHGPHQSEPEKLTRISLCDLAASVLASLKLPSQVTGALYKLNRIKNNSFIF